LIDGLRGRTLSTLSTHPVKASNLLEFLERGAFADGLAGVFPTVTYPSHTTLVTGVSPSVHGILGNGMFDPERKTNGAWYWYAKQIKSPALWDRAHAAQQNTGLYRGRLQLVLRLTLTFQNIAPIAMRTSFRSIERFAARA
jgi:predicted AlkP superfamily pyrophosphatase or phosphodiesterase